MGKVQNIFLTQINHLLDVLTEVVFIAKYEFHLKQNSKKMSGITSSLIIIQMTDAIVFIFSLLSTFSFNQMTSGLNFC